MNVVITGANRGIGLALLREYRRRGDNVIGTARDPSLCPELRLVTLDVRSDTSCDSLRDRLSFDQVHLLINNAGLGDRSRSLRDLDMQEMLDVYDTNALGPLRVTRALLPMLAAGRAKIIHVSSDMGSIERAREGHSYAYRMSKAALNMASRTMALELAPDGIASIAVHPGSVQTDMGGSGAAMTAEVAAVRLADLFDRLTTRDSGTFVEPSGTPLAF